jgi:hypothetical protein
MTTLPDRSTSCRQQACNNERASHDFLRFETLMREPQGSHVWWTWSDRPQAGSTAKGWGGTSAKDQYCRQGSDTPARVHEANQVGRTENDRGAKPSGDKSIGNRELPFSLGPHELTADETSTELQEFRGPLKIGGLVRSINPLNEADFCKNNFPVQ